MKNKLKEKREALNLRMVDVAVKAGVGVSTIWLIENGYGHRVSKPTKEKVAMALGESKPENIFPEDLSE